MKVRTLKEHGNAHGDKYLKAVGDVYSLPDKAGRRLIGARYVEQCGQTGAALVSVPPSYIIKPTEDDEGES